MKRLSINAPAKINVGLNIVGRRQDGFHNLETFFYPIYDLHDTLLFEHNDNFIFDSDNFELCKDPDNLILKAHTIIEEHVKKKLVIKLTLEKRIPMGAGLGGGSSDAAATLLGLNEYFDLKIQFSRLHEFASSLGSDVPFFLRSKPAVGYSRGEILHLSDNYIQEPILIINPGIHISTKEAFSKITPNLSNFDYKYFIKSDLINYKFLSENLNNDFEDYVFSKYSEIKDIKKQLMDNGSIYSSMSGTGSTVYGIFKNLRDAEKASALFPKTYFTFVSKLSE